MKTITASLVLATLLIINQVAHAQIYKPNKVPYVVCAVAEQSAEEGVDLAVGYFKKNLGTYSLAFKFQNTQAYLTVTTTKVGISSVIFHTDDNSAYATFMVANAVPYVGLNSFPTAFTSGKEHLVSCREELNVKNIKATSPHAKLMK